MCLLCAKHCARGFRVCEFTWQALYGTNRKEYISLHITCCWSSSSYGSRRTQCVCAQSCPTLHDAMDHSTPGLPVHDQLPESTQTRLHWLGEAIQPSHPLSSPSPAFTLPQHQGLFKCVSSSSQVAKVLEFQLQHQSYQWIPGLISFRMD